MNYRIKRVASSVFAVIVKNKYDRAMLFCRAQEYYECPSSKFRGKSYSIWDYMKWYNTRYGKGFSYGADWSGFNIPLRQINDCYNKLNNCETPYDYVMYKILQVLNLQFLSENINGYVIACDSVQGDLFKHEVCHALYFTDADYRSKVKSAISSLSERHYKIFKTNLLKMGYAPKVIDDEIQAYLQYGYEDPKFGAGVKLSERRAYSEALKQAVK